MRVSAVVNIVLLILLFGFSAAVWPALPERMPVHFGPDGQVDRWIGRSLLAWFALPLIAAGVVALLWWIGSLVPRRPELLNIPDKKAFIALSPGHRALVVKVVRESLHMVSTVILVMMTMIQVGEYRTAVAGDGEGVIIAAVLVAVVCVPISALVMIMRIQSRVTAAIRAQREEERGGV